MDKQPVGQLPDLTQSNNDDEIMVITNSEYNQLKKEKISDFITDLTSTNENNALIKGTDSKLFVTDFGDASNITEGTLPVSVLPDIPKDLLPESGVTAGTYITPTNLQVNSKGQITSISEGVASGISREDIDTVAARPLSDNACTQENFPDEFDYWYNQKYTTFNKGYIATIGTPTMTELGVISNCGDYDYFLTPSIDVTTADSWEMRFTYTPSGTTPTTAIGLFGSNWLNVSFTTANKITATVNYSGGSLTLTSTGTFNNDDKIFGKIRYDSTGYKLYASVNHFDYGTAATNSQTAKAASAQALKLGNVSARSYLSQGSIDMKYFEFDINGANVQNYKQTGIDTINGTLKIPYTETTDGTKIVDAAYFDRVQNCREQTGQALYLTLDEQNQQYYLPQGTVSGMISQNKEGLEELEAKIEQVKAQIGFTLFDTKITDHVLSGNDGVGWALQGSLVTNIYTDAVSNIASAYASGTATNYREINCKRATDGRYIADIAQKEAIDELFENTGIADFYILDSANNQFYLPKSKWFMQLAVDTDTLNQYNKSALPNITGTFNADQLYNAGGYGNGAFQNGGATSYPTPNSSSDASQGGFNFNASRSSSVYKTGQKYVQPPSSNKLLYYKVGDTLTNDTAIDIGNMSNIISDLSAKTQIDEFVVSGNTWYRKYSNGFVEQAGLATGLSTNVSTINLPVSMANTNYTILLSISGSTGGSNKNIGGIRSSSSSFTLYAENIERKTGIFWYIAGQGATN